MPYGQRIRKIRSRTVEPVLGTLINFMGIRRVNARGIKQANKIMLMAAIAYNLQKYLRFQRKAVHSKAMAMVDSLDSTLLAIILRFANARKITWSLKIEIIKRLTKMLDSLVLEVRSC